MSRALQVTQLVLPHILRDTMTLIWLKREVELGEAHLKSHVLEELQEIFVAKISAELLPHYIWPRHVQEMSLVIFIGRRRCLNRFLVRSVSTLAAQRNNLLRKVYAPFQHLSKGSLKYDELSRSGKVWEDYFQPGDSERYGYTDLQQQLTSALREIDSLKEAMKQPPSTFMKNLIPEYALQSVQIEDSHLQLRDSIRIADHLEASFFKKVDLVSISASELAKAELPDTSALFPNEDASQVTELRNHIVACHWITQTALQNTGTTGLSEDELRHISAIIIKGTKSEDIYTKGWGNRVALGGYRQTPIVVRNNPLRIFPYHVEVPVLMQRFFLWRSKSIEREMHPLVLACQAVVYFLSIHPFPDGNGRVSRLMMQDYMLRQGYIPVTLLGISRQDYLRMINNVQNGEPGEFVERVVTAQLEAMMAFMLR